MLESLGNLGDFIGGIGVVVTLVYLIFQIRQSTEQTRQNNDLIRAQISMATRESRQEGTRVIATDREAGRVFFTGLKGRDNLSEDDQQQFDPLLTLFTQSWDMEFELGGGEQVTDISGVVQQPGYREWWQLYRSSFSEAFRELVEERMASTSPAAEQDTTPESASTGA